MAGTVYYRLIQIDLNGAFKYSKVIAVSVKMLPEAKNLTRAVVYSNPFASEEVLTAETELTQALVFSLSLVDITATTLQTKVVPGQAGNHKITLGPFQQVPAGIYLLRVYQGDHVVVHKLVKNR